MKTFYFDLNFIIKNTDYLSKGKPGQTIRIIIAIIVVSTIAVLAGYALILFLDYLNDKCQRQPGTIWDNKLNRCIIQCPGSQVMCKNPNIKTKAGTCITNPCAHKRNSDGIAYKYNEDTCVCDLDCQFGTQYNPLTGSTSGMEKVSDTECTGSIGKWCGGDDNLICGVPCPSVAGPSHPSPFIDSFYDTNTKYITGGPGFCAFRTTNVLNKNNNAWPPTYECQESWWLNNQHASSAERRPRPSQCLKTKGVSSSDGHSGVKPGDQPVYKSVGTIKQLPGGQNYCPIFSPNSTPEIYSTPEGYYCRQRPCPPADDYSGKEPIWAQPCMTDNDCKAPGVEGGPCVTNSVLEARGFTFGLCSKPVIDLEMDGRGGLHTCTYIPNIGQTVNDKLRYCDSATNGGLSNKLQQCEQAATSGTAFGSDTVSNNEYVCIAPGGARCPNKWQAYVDKTTICKSENESEAEKKYPASEGKTELDICCINEKTISEGEVCCYLNETEPTYSNSECGIQIQPMRPVARGLCDASAPAAEYYSPLRVPMVNNQPDYSQISKYEQFFQNMIFTNKQNWTPASQAEAKYVKLIPGNQIHPLPKAPGSAPPGEYLYPLCGRAWETNDKPKLKNWNNPLTVPVNLNSSGEEVYTCSYIEYVESCNETKFDFLKTLPGTSIPLCEATDTKASQKKGEYWTADASYFEYVYPNYQLTTKKNLSRVDCAGNTLDAPWKRIIQEITNQPSTISWSWSEGTGPDAGDEITFTYNCLDTSHGGLYFESHDKKHNWLSLSEPSYLKSNKEVLNIDTNTPHDAETSSGHAPQYFISTQVPRNPKVGISLAECPPATELNCDKNTKYGSYECAACGYLNKDQTQSIYETVNSCGSNLQASCDCGDVICQNTNDNLGIQLDVKSQGLVERIDNSPACSPGTTEGSPPGPPFCCQTNTDGTCLRYPTSLVESTTLQEEAPPPPPTYCKSDQSTFRVGPQDNYPKDTVKKLSYYPVKYRWNQSKSELEPTTIQFDTSIVREINGKFDPATLPEPEGCRRDLSPKLTKLGGAPDQPRYRDDGGHGQNTILIEGPPRFAWCGDDNSEPLAWYSQYGRCRKPVPIEEKNRRRITSYSS